MKLLLVLLITLSLYGSDFYTEQDNPQAYCLSEAIYFEARGSSLADQAAVADVILNRVSSSKYPNNVCSVVRQAKLWKSNPIRNQCQFSYYCDGKSDRMTDLDAKANAQWLAIQVLVFGKFRGITENATMYHADYVNPYWAPHMQLVGTIGRHIFYREN